MWAILLLLPSICLGRQVAVENATQFLSELQAWTGEEAEPIDLFMPPGLMSMKTVDWRPGSRSIRNGTLSVIGAAAPEERTLLDLAGRRPGAWRSPAGCQCMAPTAWACGSTRLASL